MSISFAISASLSTHSEFVYRKMFGWLRRFERDFCRPHDAPIDLGSVRAVIFGMGRIGSGTYDELHEHFGSQVCGVEHAPDLVDFNRSQGRNDIPGNACDTEFWLKLRKDLRLELVILAMPNHQGDMFAASQSRKLCFDCQVAATAPFPEEVEELSAFDVCTACNMNEQAGAGLGWSASDGCRLQG